MSGINPNTAPTFREMERDWDDFARESDRRHRRRLWIAAVVVAAAAVVVVALLLHAAGVA